MGKRTSKPAKETTTKQSGKRTTKPANGKPARSVKRTRNTDHRPIRRRGAENGVPECFDITLENAYISITSPRTGQAKFFWVRIQRPGEFMEGKRIAYVYDDTRNGDPDLLESWKGFSWVTEYGLEVFQSRQGFAKPSVYEKYADMLERMSFYQSLGCKYTIQVTK